MIVANNTAARIRRDDLVMQLQADLGAQYVTIHSYLRCVYGTPICHVCIR